MPNVNTYHVYNINHQRQNEMLALLENYLRNLPEGTKPVSIFPGPVAGITVITLGAPAYAEQTTANSFQRILDIAKPKREEKPDESKQGPVNGKGPAREVAKNQRGKKPSSRR